MEKKYIVRLSQEERKLCEQVVDKLQGTSQKVRRARSATARKFPAPGGLPLVRASPRTITVERGPRSLETSSRNSDQTRP